MIAIIDYQAGNIGSIQNMLKRLGYESTITCDADVVNNAGHIILPGVGSFDYGIQKLKELDLVSVLNKKKDEGTPILGICLGAQLMCNSSEEGVLPGLGWIPAVVKKFLTSQNGKKFTVPHMGWDIVDQAKKTRLLENIETPSRFYFVHSYYIQCTYEHHVLTTNKYSTKYHSSFEDNNILGVQFHPEKSHKFGKQLLKNFIEKY